MTLRALLLITGLLANDLQAQEITLHHIKQAVCQIETGTVYVAPGKVVGRYSRGEAGEIGPWQMLPEVCRERGFDPVLVKASTRLAEQAFMAHIEYLASRTPNLREAVAAYHRGLGGRHRKEAKAYATNVLNLATRLAQEQQ